MSNLIHPVKKVFITQEWGVNPDRYVRWNLSGHNGVDYRCFDKDGNKATTCEVFAPHSGTIIEAGWDADGYGYYYKIENGEEGSILGHFKTLLKSVGDGVNQGDMIGIGDNTGNSTGCHVHWGYYKKPRFRDNGYSGTINQLLLMKEEPTEPECKFTDQTIIPIGGDWGDMELQQVRSTLNDQKRDVEGCKGDLAKCEKECVRQLTQLEMTKNRELAENKARWQLECESANLKYEKLELEYNELLATTLKAVSFWQFIKDKFFS